MSINTFLVSSNSIRISTLNVQIRKAYRKKALQCHPDKNPDNPKAAELFHELSKALEILLDTSARAAYNRVIEAKKAAELRTQQLDSKRQKLKADLEERERQANLNQARRQAYSTVSKSPEEALKDEIERLRKEGSKLLEEEQELMQKQLKEERLKMNSTWDSSQYRIKIKWNASKSDVSNGGYTKELIEKFLQKYGDIVVLVMSPKKNGSALVEFKTQDAAEMAVSYEKGRMENPMTLEWIGNPPKSKNNPTGSSTISDSDYESLVLRQMRQAEERKRLIEEMLKED